MMVKRVNWYLNKGIKIMTNEQESVRVALEAILLLLYAWNSCPIPGMDISRSLIAVRCEFAFPFDYSTNKPWELTSLPSTAESYSQDLATCLSALREVAHLLIQERHAYHRELISSCRPDPRTYSVGNVVFARRAVHSDSSKGRINKLQYTFTGLWRITAVLKGASYELEHCFMPTCKVKKHASNLSPYPLKLIPFQPVEGSDNRYGQLHRPITANPFKEAGIEGFKPFSPFKVTAQYLTTDTTLAFHWPSLSELNDKMPEFKWSSEDERQLYLSGDSISTLPVMYTGPPPAAPSYSLPAIPPPNILTRLIIQSLDRLFFISHSIGSNEARKWRLVQGEFEELMSSYPLCLQDGCFRLDFFICHPSDSRINAINQRYWLQYHTMSKLQSPLSLMETHLIKPSNTSIDYAQRHKLRPFRKWLNLTHLDTFIYRPFKFASVNDRKTRDRVSQADWDILKLHLNMFHNPIPQFDVPSYSIHVDRCAHVQFHDAAISRQLILAASHATDSPSMPTYQSQKVIAFMDTTPGFFFCPFIKCLSEV